MKPKQFELFCLVVVKVGQIEFWYYNDLKKFPRTDLRFSYHLLYGYCGSGRWDIKTEINYENK